ncbi:hypothetical protein D3C75_856520 [compost metagenome]
MTDLFIIGDEQGKIVQRFPAFALNALQQTQQRRHTGFVVQMAGFDIAARRDHRPGIKGDEVTDGNAELQHVVFGGDHFVNADLHIFLRTFEITRIRIDMNRGMAAQNRAGVG